MFDLTQEGLLESRSNCLNTHHVNLDHSAQFAQRPSRQRRPDSLSCAWVLRSGGAVCLWWNRSARPIPPPHAMSFETPAPYYRALELVTAVGMLQRCRTAFLAETQGCRRALLLGEGPGPFLAALLRTNPDVDLTLGQWRSKLDRHPSESHAVPQNKSTSPRIYRRHKGWVTSGWNRFSKPTPVKRPL